MNQTLYCRLVVLAIVFAVPFMPFMIQNTAFAALSSSSMSCVSSFTHRCCSDLLRRHGGHCASRSTSMRRLETLSSSVSAKGRTVSRLPPVPDDCHRFIFMRHGQSSFNDAAIFTGWCDVGLTRRGEIESLEAGEVLRSHHLQFRKCYTSLLTRSIITAQRCLEAAGVAYTPLSMDWRFNERHYGALQGLSKEQTAVRLGRDIVMEWRRSYDARPPLMTDDHPHFATINADPRYRHLTQQQIRTTDDDDDDRTVFSLSSSSSGTLPRAESLADCQVRVVEAWKDVLEEIRTEFDEGSDFNYSLLVAHANTLRALVQYLDGIPVREIEGLNIPTAIPFAYDINKWTGQVVMSSFTSTSKEETVPGSFRGIFIADERKQQSFLERRRAANDPWLWALHDDQVAPSVLLNVKGISDTTKNKDLMVALEEEARKNTNLFAPGQTDSTTG